MASNISGAASGLASSPGLLGAFRGHYGGNTKAMAQALGVSQRTVQRWFTSGKEKRAPSKAARGKMAQHVPVKAHVSGQFYFDTPGFRSSPDTRDRDITFNASPEQMQDILNALIAGDEEMAGVHFFEAYGMAAPDAVIGADYSFSV